MKISRKNSKYCLSMQQNILNWKLSRSAISKLIFAFLKNPNLIKNFQFWPTFVLCTVPWDGYCFSFDRNRCSLLLYLYIVSSIFRLSRLLAVAHAFWHHAGFNQIQQLPELVRDKFLPIVRTEEQLLFIYHLAGPFLQRLHTERYTRWVFFYITNKS